MISKSSAYKSPSRILLLGCNGQVGWELQRALAAVGEVVMRDRASCDLLNFDTLRTTIIETAPQVIVNAAAYTAVDKAEYDSAIAEKINAEAVGLLAAICKQHGALLVHYSTDYVFDGEKSEPYIETDATTPLSVYGASKQRGEQAVIESGCDFLIFRTSWVFATRGGNFAKTILRLAQERENLRIVADQWGAPTSAELIADVTAHALREMLAGRSQGGLFHLAAAGETTWHGYAKYIVEQAIAMGIPLKTTSIEPIPTSSYPLPAKRPANSRLDTIKLRSTFNLILPDWRYHVRRMLIEQLGNHQ
jgi:dTDP-4-dehydrorhamnose reductase